MTAEAIAATGATYRQLDYWSSLGYIRCEDEENPGSGGARVWSSAELEIATWIVRLREVGFELAPAAAVAREVVGTFGNPVLLSEYVTVVVVR